MRPCIVKGKKAIFHQWAVRAWIVEPSLFKGGNPGGQVSMTQAVVEYEDGTVEEVCPADLRFADSANALRKAGHRLCYEEQWAQALEAAT